MLEKDGLQLPPRWRMWVLCKCAYEPTRVHISTSKHEKAVMVSYMSRVRQDREVLVWKQQHSVKVVMPFCGRGVTTGRRHMVGIRRRA